MQSYPALQKLKSYFTKCSIRIEQGDSPVHESFIAVDLYLDDQQFTIQVDDEFDDFNLENQLVCLFLILNSLEEYHECDDIIIWCRQYGLNPAEPKILNYYRNLDGIYTEIESILGEVDSCIAPMDYQLRTGVIQAMKSLK